MYVCMYVSNYVRMHVCMHIQVMYMYIQTHTYAGPGTLQVLKGGSESVFKWFQAPLEPQGYKQCHMISTWASKGLLHHAWTMLTIMALAAKHVGGCNYFGRFKLEPMGSSNKLMTNDDKYAGN